MRRFFSWEPDGSEGVLGNNNWAADLFWEDQYCEIASGGVLFSVRGEVLNFTGCRRLCHIILNHPKKESPTCFCFCEWERRSADGHSSSSPSPLLSPRLLPERRPCLVRGSCKSILIQIWQVFFSRVLAAIRGNCRWNKRICSAGCSLAAEEEMNDL